jgi:hypothetical protein
MEEEVPVMYLTIFGMRKVWQNFMHGIKHYIDQIVSKGCRKFS